MILRTLCAVAALIFCGMFSAQAAEVPLAELRALERAIESGLDKRELGSQTLGDLQRLQDRLEQGEPENAAKDDVAQLEREAGEGKRSALRTLSLYRLYQNNPEEALRLWHRMGDANENDLAYRLMSSYLELSLGEYEKARTHLEAADRLIGTRTGLGLSTPVFCENIAGYRLYAERAAKDFLPGENTLVYVEVEGADFHQVARGESECRLMFGMRLKNDAGVTVWSEANYGEYSPVFNGPIRDLHTALTWRVPNDLTPGVYTLIVEAVEDSSKRRGDSVVEFNVARRATNPEKRLDEGMRRDVNRALQESGKLFPGAGQQLFRQEESGDGFRTNKHYELLRQFERLGKGTE